RARAPAQATPPTTLEPTLQDHLSRGSRLTHQGTRQLNSYRREQGCSEKQEEELNNRRGKGRGKDDRSNEGEAGKECGVLTTQPAPMCLPACGQASLGYQRIPLRCRRPANSQVAGGGSLT